MSEIKEYQVLCQAAEMADRISEGMSELLHFLEQNRDSESVSHTLKDHNIESAKNTMYACGDALRIRAYVKGRKAIKEFNNLPNE